MASKMATPILGFRVQGVSNCQASGSVGVTASAQGDVMEIVGSSLGLWGLHGRLWGLSWTSLKKSAKAVWNAKRC